MGNGFDTTESNRSNAPLQSEGTKEQKYASSRLSVRLWNAKETNRWAAVTELLLTNDKQLLRDLFQRRVNIRG